MKYNTYTFAEITWAVGCNEYTNNLYVVPLVYTDKFLTDLNGNEVYCNNLKEGIEKLFSKFELTIKPNVNDIVNENSCIKGVDIFKLGMYGLKEKATIFANNFHHQSIVFNPDDYYNLKVATKEFTIEKLHSVAVKATKAIRNAELKKNNENIKTL